MRGIACPTFRTTCDQQSRRRYPIQPLAGLHASRKPERTPTAPLPRDIRFRTPRNASCPCAESRDRLRFQCAVQPSPAHRTSSPSRDWKDRSKAALDVSSRAAPPPGPHAGAKPARMDLLSTAERLAGRRGTGLPGGGDWTTSHAAGRRPDAGKPRRGGRRSSRHGDGRDEGARRNHGFLNVQARRNVDKPGSGLVVTKCKIDLRHSCTSLPGGRGGRRWVSVLSGGGRGP